MALCDTKTRKEVEEMIYGILDEIDDTKTNSDYYRQLFSTMSNDEFYHFFERRLPIRIHYEIFKIEPTMDKIVKAFKKLGEPLFEKVNMRHIYVNKKGKPVQSKECLVIPIHIKRLKQMVISKSHVSMNTEKRDMRDGLLTSEDKGAKETDREFESLEAFGLEYTVNEFSRPRADSLRAAAQMNSVIMSKGFINDSDITIDRADSLSKNMLNVYLLGAHIHTNLLDIDYMTPYTAKNKHKEIERL